MIRYFLITVISLLPYSLFALECPEGQFLVNAHPRTSYYRTDGTFVNSSNVETYCKEYTFSKPLILKYLSSMPEGWPNQLELFKAWSPSEKKLLEKEIAKLPKMLRDQGEITLLRAIRSAFPDNPSTAAPDESIIVFYDNAKKFGYKRVLAHEMAHLLFKKLSDDERKSYYKAADWLGQEPGNFKTARKNFSETDGILGPEEDFANNVEHILIDKKHNNAISSSIEKCVKNILGIKK